MSFITTITELKQYIAIDANTKMVTVQPAIDEAERRYIRPLLGADFYAEFLGLYTESVAPSPTPLDDDAKALLPFVQKALANYVAYSMVSKNGVRFGDLGMQETSTADSQPAPKWKVRDIQVEFFKSADLAADDLLAFLEENASDSVYTTWYQDASANTSISGAIVYSTAIASKHIDISESRRLFMRLKKYILNIETQFIPKLISQDQYDELVQQLQDNSVTDDNRTLLDLIEPIIAKRALYQALPFIKVSINPEGIHLLSSSDSVLRQEFATKEDIEELECSLEHEEFGYKADEAQLRQFILDNIDNYPLIKDSAVYTVQPDPGPTWTTLNDRDNKHFGV